MGADELTPKMVVANADLDALERIVRAATPSPWRAATMNDCNFVVHESAPHGPVIVIANVGPNRVDDANSVMIAALHPERILSLLVEARRGRELAVLLRWMIDKAKRMDSLTLGELDSATKTLDGV